MMILENIIILQNEVDMVKPDAATMKHDQIHHFIYWTISHDEPNGVCKYLVHHILAPSLGFYVGTLSHFHPIVRCEQSRSGFIRTAGRRGGLVDPSWSIEGGRWYQGVVGDFHQGLWWQRERRQCWSHVLTEIVLCWYVIWLDFFPRRKRTHFILNKLHLWKSFHIWRINTFYRY